MTRREVPEDLQREAVKKLIDMKLVNDYEYACAFIRTRNLMKPRSIRVLRLELRKKGIDKQTAEKALQSVEVDEVMHAQRLISSKDWRWKALDKAEYKRKVFEYLMRQGFSGDTIKKAMNVDN